MSDIGQMNLKEPEPVNWEEYNSGSRFQAPPPALGPDGKPITYYGVVADAKEDTPDEGYLNYILDPIKIVQAGTDNGYTLRFTRASVKPFTKKGPDGEPIAIKGNPNKLANLLRAAGLAVKPQTNADYRAAVKAVVAAKKPVMFTIDWEAYNKDTGERVKGYLAFPDDPQRPGQKKAVLKAGDVINEVDSKGNIIGTKTVTSEVLFANARLRYFQDATPKRKT